MSRKELTKDEQEVIEQVTAIAKLLDDSNELEIINIQYLGKYTFLKFIFRNVYEKDNEIVNLTIANKDIFKGLSEYYIIERDER